MKNLELPIEHGKFKGRVDAVFQNAAGELMLVDWKFASSKRNIQLTLKTNRFQILKYASMYEHVFKTVVKYPVLCIIIKAEALFFTFNYNTSEFVIMK